MTRNTPVGIIAILAVGSWLVAASQQTPPTALVILDPAADSYVAGPIVLKAALDPPAEIVRMDFYADGELVCQVRQPPFECQWNAGPDVRSHSIRVVALLPDGSRLIKAIHTLRLPDFSEAVDVNVVLVPAVVTNWLGRFVKGLSQDDFLVFEDDAPQKITYFQSEKIPLDVVVAIDVSGSMRPIMPEVRIAVKQFLAGFKESDRITLLAFNDRIFVLAKQETDQARLSNAVDSVAPAGGTSLYDAVLASLELLGPEIRRRAVVIFTDGYDQSSRSEVELVERWIRESDALLYFITQGQAAKAEEVQLTVQRLAAQSGGQAFAVPKIKELREALDAIREDLRNQYLLGYEPAKRGKDSEYRRIKVKLADGRHSVRAREGYKPQYSR